VYCDGKYKNSVLLHSTSDLTITTFLFSYEDHEVLLHLFVYQLKYTFGCQFLGTKQLLV